MQIIVWMQANWNDHHTMICTASKVYPIQARTHPTTIAISEMKENSTSLMGSFTLRFLITKNCQIVKTRSSGGNTRFTRLLGMKTMRNTITTNAMSMNGV